MVAIRNMYRILFRKPERKRSPGRPSRRWEDIRMDVREIGWEGVGWIHLLQGRDQWRAVVKAVMNLRVPREAENFLINWATISFSRSTMLHGASHLLQLLFNILHLPFISGGRLSRICVMLWRERDTFNTE
jgi:hypothetical protein